MRPSFSVVTVVTSALVGVGLFVHFALPLTSLGPGNRLASSQQEFLQSGNLQAIDWFPLSDAPFVKARRTGKPIFMVIGTPWSRTGRFVDQKTFTDSTVTRLLARDFICVRVDGMRQPDWLNALLPFNRLESEFLPGWQGWILDPAGRMLGFIGRAKSVDIIDSNQLVSDLLAARSSYEKLLGSPGELDAQAGARQHEELDRVRNADLLAPTDFQGYDNALQNGVDREHGGLPRNGMQMLQPLAWNFLLKLGQLDAFSSSIDPVLTSPMDDLVDGGFFHSTESVDLKRVTFEKLTEENAEMMELLARAAAITGNRNYDVLAHRVWGFLAGQMVKDALFYQCRLADDLPDERSMHSSFPPSATRRLLSEDDQIWSMANLGLDAVQNHAMVPYPVHLDVLQDPSNHLTRVINALRKAQPVPVHLAGYGMLGCSGFAAARMLETARIWRDPAALTLAENLCDGLETIRAMDGSLRADMGGIVPNPCLTDLLAYSDAKLADYVSSGHTLSFNPGLEVLQEALKTFATDTPGVYHMAPETLSSLSVADSLVPEIADNTHESATAQLMRLCVNYSRMVSDRRLGAQLFRKANTMLARFSAIAQTSSPRVAGFYNAALDVMDNRYAIAVGPQAQELADSLQQKVPTRFIAPAFGPVRQDLQSRPPGIYVIHGKEVRGPFTLGEAYIHLPVAYTFAS